MLMPCAPRNGARGWSVNWSGATVRRSIIRAIAKPFLGRRIACTWQTGEAAIIAAKLGVPVVSDFRPADMAAGGKGAPLVPFLDYVLYRHRRYGRIVQNLGGIANLTAIPPRAQPQHVVAFDTGPGNMVIDAVTDISSASLRSQWPAGARGEPIERVLQRVAAASVLSAEAAKDCRARTVWTRVCARIPSPLPTCRQERHCGYGNRAHCSVYSHRSAQICVATVAHRGTATGALSRICRLRRRDKKHYPDADDPRGTRATEDAGAHQR